MKSQQEQQKFSSQKLWLARASLCSVADYKAQQAYFFISIRKEKAALPPYLLSAMKNLEPVCAVKGLICCGCLINKAVVYLITFLHSNCKEFQMCVAFPALLLLWNRCLADCPWKGQISTQTLLLVGHEEKPELREGVSPSARNMPFFFCCRMGKRINVCAWKPGNGIRLFWLEIQY